VILNEDGSRNSAENPAAPESMVTVFCNGVGRVGMDNGYAVPATPVSVFIDGFYANGVDAHVVEVEGIAGPVFQIRVRVPNPKLPDLPNFRMPPTVAVQLEVGGVRSQLGVSIAIRQ
jgi:uncharacterized protein (TIGR03437 family)